MVPEVCVCMKSSASSSYTYCRGVTLFGLDNIIMQCSCFCFRFFAQKESVSSHAAAAGDALPFSFSPPEPGQLKSGMVSMFRRGDAPDFAMDDPAYFKHVAR